MLIGEEWKTATIANGGTLSDEVDLQRPYDTLMVMIPTIDTAEISLLVAEEAGGTFLDLYLVEGDGSSTIVKSNSGTGAIAWFIPIGGFQFLKVKTSAAQTGGARTFRIRGARS